MPVIFNPARKRPRRRPPEFPFSQQGKWTGATLPGHMTWLPSHSMRKGGWVRGDTGSLPRPPCFTPACACRFNPLGGERGAGPGRPEAGTRERKPG
ncbi:hypothetical protein AOLI_G00200630 [Acnodon oligacanthus]